MLIVASAGLIATSIITEKRYWNLKQEMKDCVLVDRAEYNNYEKAVKDTIIKTFLKDLKTWEAELIIIPYEILNNFVGRSGDPIKKTISLGDIYLLSKERWKKYTG